MKSIKIAYCLNIIIVVLVICATTVMFTGYKFMHGYDVVLQSTKLGMLKFFTVDSNLFMGFVALYMSFKEKQVIKGKIKKIPKTIYIFKLMATSSVMLTFIVVFAYLGPISKDGTISLLQNSNLFFHFLIPVLSMLTFVIFERNNILDIKDVCYGVLPTIVYGVFYIINVLIHMKKGKVDFKYDWYWFVQNGVWTAIIVVPIILFISYLISLIIWKVNKNKKFIV